MTYKTDEEIVKEFDEKFSDYIRPISIGQYNNEGVNTGFLSSVQVIKSFILQLRSDDRKALIEEVEKLEKKKIYQAGPNDKMWVKMRMSKMTKKKDGYNSALSDIISLLTNKK